MYLALYYYSIFSYSPDLSKITYLKPTISPLLSLLKVKKELGSLLIPTIEKVAEQVGYNSKSAFNTAFKKNTSETLSEFRDS